MKGKLYVYIHWQNELAIICDENKIAVFNKTFYATPA